MSAASSNPNQQAASMTPAGDGASHIPEIPSTRAVLEEWVDSISFWKDATRALPAFYALFHFAGFLVFVWYLWHHASWAGALTIVLLACFIGTIYNTVWYHRYCSHQAFKFRSLWFARLFLWTNPISFREESYVLPHRVHHAKSDEPGDPYGPHLGWLGSYLAAETRQNASRNITPDEYQRLARSLEHCGFVMNSYERFQRTGSVENVWHYAAHVLFAIAFWSLLAYLAAGWLGVLVWHSAVFIFTMVLRDFNFRGHSSLVGAEPSGAPVNQMIYGLIAGEWHENHHRFPRLARSGLTWWQVDAPYWLIKCMKGCGLVTKYNAAIPSGSGAPATE